jgi:hypothetical protein
MRETEVFELVGKTAVHRAHDSWHVLQPSLGGGALPSLLFLAVQLAILRAVMSGRSSVALPRIDGNRRLLRLRADPQLSDALKLSVDGRAARLTIRSREDVSVGEPIRVEVSLGALTDEVLLGGCVAQIDREDGGAPRLTILIEGDHLSRVAYIKKVIGGAEPSSARAQRRCITDFNTEFFSLHGRGSGRVLDLSQGGAFVATDRAPKVGSAIELELALPSEGPPLRVRGQVAWVTPRDIGEGFGVCFQIPDRTVASAVSDLVRERALQL